MCISSKTTIYQDIPFMFIIIDARAPKKVFQYFDKLGNVVKFKTNGICYEGISGHPDIFMFQSRNQLVIAPNLPDEYVSLLEQNSIPFLKGEIPVGNKYPRTALYNALDTKHGLLHNTAVTDPVISSCVKQFIHCKQAYVRCSTIELGDVLITSDKGIKRVLNTNSLNSLYVDPQNIVLQGFKNGFLGGCCGVWKNFFYFCGSLKFLSNADMLRKAIDKQGYQLVELFNGCPVDVGGIFFLNSNM